MTTRDVKIGRLTVRVMNVPDNISEDELYTYALMKLWEINKKKAIKEMAGFEKAS